MVGLLPVLRVVAAGVTRPFGDERTVQQAFPGALSASEADPFLMCDYFGGFRMTVAQGEDDFPVDWHPHRGMDILSYIKTGLGRHADSLGNRETFETPGMQWMSVGSGVEHAEGGATPAGEPMEGFQIWVNVPASKKMEDPRYGTHAKTEIPVADLGPGASCRVLAGEVGKALGPFATSQPVLMLDFELDASAEATHELPQGMDNAIVYVYQGAGLRVNDKLTNIQDVVRLDATNPTLRTLKLEAPKDSKIKALLFAGKRLDEPIAWHGPIVMNTQAEIDSCLKELRSGKFPPVRVPWDYKRAKARPRDL